MLIRILETYSLNKSSWRSRYLKRGKREGAYLQAGVKVPIEFGKKNKLVLDKRRKN